ncbi:hypothetical protein Vafri_12212 [Volvox africanus]|nr:hypothetical protein Vafri_12212 [Volvox africanus]
MTNSAAELPRVSLPTPVLLLDDKLDAKKTSARVRAFIRDVNLFFGVIPWGRDQRSCCLFLSQALRGNAKVWYDEWSLSQTQLTVESILDNLRIRFAPQILSVEQEARQKLADKSFYMRAGENVPAYHARLEALVQDIPDIHPREKLFGFNKGYLAFCSLNAQLTKRADLLPATTTLCVTLRAKRHASSLNVGFIPVFAPMPLPCRMWMGMMLWRLLMGSPQLSGHALVLRRPPPQLLARALPQRPVLTSITSVVALGAGGMRVGAVRVTSRVVVVTAVGVVLTNRPCRLTRSASSLGSITGMVAR